jgi:hypothetical protein
MKFILPAILSVVLISPAVAQTKEILVGAYDGGRLATSRKAAEIKNKRGYTPGAEVISAFWVEARKPDNGPVEVALVGERLRFILPTEAPQQREWGPSDPPNPVQVGSPWRDADLRYRGIEIHCISDAYWCSQKWFIEVVLPEGVIRSVVNNPKTKEIRLTLSNRRRVDWRTPRDELMATLEALGVLAEFFEAPTK